jgi:hypothetical protein
MKNVLLGSLIEIMYFLFELDVKILKFAIQDD